MIVHYIFISSETYCRYSSDRNKHTGYEALYTSSSAPRLAPWRMIANIGGEELPGGGGGGERKEATTHDTISMTKHAAVVWCGALCVCEIFLLLTVIIGVFCHLLHGYNGEEGKNEKVLWHRGFTSASRRWS